MVIVVNLEVFLLFFHVTKYVFYIFNDLLTTKT